MEGFTVERMKNVCLIALACAFVLEFAVKNGAGQQPANRTGEATVGLFEGHGDVGAV